MTATNAQLTRIQLGDAPTAWADAGFTVVEGVLRLGSTTVALSGSGDGFEGWAIEGVAEPIDGLGSLDPAPEPSSPVTDHPNGITRIDHVVVRSDDCDRSVGAFASAGFEVRGGRTTSSYGAPMRQVFFWAGDVIIELIGPERALAHRSEGSEPASIFGLALVADDLDATAGYLGDLLGRPKDAVQPGRRIAGLRGAEVGMSLPIAVMSRHARPEGARQATDG